MSEFISPGDWAEEVAENAENLSQLVARWPAGHRLHDLIPGVFATVIMMEAEKNTPKDEVEKFINEVYATAGMPGHRHASMTYEAAMDMVILMDEESNAA
jgi:hypothetical protein